MMLSNRRSRTISGVLPILVLCCASLLVSALHAGDTAHWYKGNTHAHSLWSDGDEFPEMVADWYKTHGYDFLAISDHDRPAVRAARTAAVRSWSTWSR